MVQQNQFGGEASEDPNIHLTMFLQVADTIKFNGVDEHAIRLRLFPFSLKGKALAWFHALQPGCISTWEELVDKFLTKFFPPSKSSKLRSEIGLNAMVFIVTFFSWEASELV